jgi:riboflavin kinase / FMN adenylyltransferase
MRVLSWDEFVAGALRGLPLAATIGVFDGLHIGHRQLISRVIEREGLSSAVFTFRENPKQLLSPESFVGELSTLAQKLELVSSLGADVAVLIDFSGDFSKLPGRRFLSLLKEGTDLRFIAVGANFRCGYRLDTDAEGIAAFCAEGAIGMEAFSAVSWAGHPVSSSRIRRALRDGHVEDAAFMLGRPYALDLRGRAVCRGSDGKGTWRLGGGQVQPPAGRYEASLSYAATAAVSVVAEHEGKGLWSFDASGAPDALSLVRSVSRE